MTTCNHIVLMASYNQWMNEKLYDAAAKLSAEDLSANRNAFFGSIIGTLNHIAVADTIWLQRFTKHSARYSALDAVQQLPAPTSLDQLLFTDITALSARRKMLDTVISQWAVSLQESDLQHVLHYTTTKGIAASKLFYSVIMHFFNHQTHHRGQATTLLSQLGIDIGVTDLLALVPDQTNL